MSIHSYCRYSLHLLSCTHTSLNWSYRTYSNYYFCFVYLSEWNLEHFFLRIAVSLCFDFTQLFHCSLGQYDCLKVHPLFGYSISTSCLLLIDYSIDFHSCNFEALLSYRGALLGCLQLCFGLELMFFGISLHRFLSSNKNCFLIYLCCFLVSQFSFKKEAKILYFDLFWRSFN